MPFVPRWYFRHCTHTGLLLHFQVESPEAFFLPCCKRLVGEKQLPLITLPLQITLFSLTKKLFFFFFPFSWGDVEFEMLMAQKSLSLLSLFMVLFEGKNFPACGWDNREMLSGGIFHSTWPYAIKGQFGHTSQWTWRHQSFAGLMWKSKCFNSSQVKLLPPNCLSLHLPSHL